MAERRPERDPRFTRRWAKRLALVCGGLAVGLLLAEGLLRLLGISYPHLYTPDAYCASRLRPGVRGWWVTEGRAFVAINRDAMRDREHPLEKSAGTLRIAVLGDSYTEAMQVPAGETYWSLAEQALNDPMANPGREGRVEFLNFGCAGYGTTQELMMLRHHVWKYRPDVVLLAFCHNDVEDNSRTLSGYEARPYAELDGDKLVFDMSFRESAAYTIAQSAYEQRKASLVNASYLLQVLKRAKLNLQGGHNVPPSPTAAPGPASDFQDMTNAVNMYAPPTTEAGERAWEVTERLIVAVRDEAQRNQATFGLLTVSTPLQVHPDPALRRRFEAAGQIADFHYSERRLQALGARYGFPVLALAEPLQAYAEKHREFLHGFANTPPGYGHWNQTGHRLAAQHMTRWLVEQRLVPSR